MSVPVLERQDAPPAPPVPPPPPARRPPAPQPAPLPDYSPPTSALFALMAFILGGLAFGAIFLGNVRSLMERPAVANAVAAVQNSNKPGSSSDGSATTPANTSGVSLPNLALNLLPEWSGTDRINIVLLGVDKRDDEPYEGTRSDTIILVSIDPVGKAAAMVSIPRDLWVNIPTYGPQRINVAHAVGGPELSKRTITADFGIPIQYYARVDFHGFQDLVDTVGGVMIDVDRPVKDDEYPTEDYGYQRIYIAPGPQLMDGTTALYYARSRHSENDFARARRQQKVVVGVRDRALQLNMLPRARELMGIVQKAITTDLSPLQLLQLARLGSEIDRDRISNVVLDTEYARPFKGQDGADLLQPDYPAIRRGIDNAIKSSEHPELHTRIEVLNGTSTVGLGQTASQYLTNQGFDVVRVAVADRSDYTATSLQVLTGNTQVADSVASALKLNPDAVQDNPSPSPSADIRLIIGQDFAIPQSR